MVRTRKRGQRGFTLTELMIASFMSVFVLLALGRLILMNQRSWEWGRDKAVLQQNTTEALEWMARQVRAAHSIAVVDSTEFRTYDSSGTLLNTYRRVVSGGGRLQQNGSDLVDRRCTGFIVTTDDDTSSVILQLALEDDSGSQVAATTRAAIRNRSHAF